MENNAEDKYIIRRAGYEDVDNIIGLMHEVYEEIEDKDTFICDDKAFVLRHIETEGFALIAENRTFSALSGVFIVRYPQNSDDNLGKYAGLSENNLMRVAHMESTVVKMSERGHHLQAYLLRECEKCIDDKHDIFMCVASPKNTASIKTLSLSGYFCVKENVDYNGFKRNIYMKYRDK